MHNSLSKKSVHFVCVSAGNSAKKYEKESKERNFIFYISFVRASISISHHQRKSEIENGSSLVCIYIPHIQYISGVKSCKHTSWYNRKLYTHFFSMLVHEKYP